MTDHLLDRRQLITLVNSGAVRKCTIRSAGNQWIISIDTPNQDFVVGKQRSPNEIRQFKTLDTACLYVKDLGLGRVTVELAGWTPNQKQLAIS